MKKSTIKKTVISLLIVSLALLLSCLVISLIISRAFQNPVISSLPKYENSDCYYGEGFQDYTDYCKYYYSNSDSVINKLNNNKYFKLVTDNDVKEVKSYFENFEGWVEYKEYKDKYDFEYESVDTADYFYIENKYTCDKYKHYPDKYSAYNVYFFDVQTKVLYLIHSNI